MSKLVPYFKRGFELFDTALNKTLGQYIVLPLHNYVLRPGTNIAYKGARKVYYLYNPKARKFNRMAEENVKKLKTYDRRLWFSGYTTPRHLATTRKLLNLLPMSNTPCRIGRRQLQGTCWFQSIINGWLLADKSREFLKARLAAYKRYKNVKNINTKSCPIRKFDPDFFFSYVDSYFNGNKNSNQKRYKNLNLIANLSLAQNRKEKGAQGAAVIENTEIFLKNIFGTNWSVLPNMDIMLWKPSKTIDLPPKLSGYILSHASIVMYPMKGNNYTGTPHAITGYICNGKPIVYDSNGDTYLDINWTSKKDLKKLNDYYSFYKPYHKNSERVETKIVCAIYLRNRPKFLNQTYVPQKLNYSLLSNKRLENLTGISNRNLALRKIREIENTKKISINPHTSLNILKNIYRKKFKEEPPKITNSRTLYHKIKGIPYNHKLEYEYNLRNMYNISHINDFLISLYGRTNNKLSKDNKKKILETFYYNTPWYNEAPINIWRKAYKLKFGVNAPSNLNTNKKLYNAYTKNA